jgi:hypothetical protein
VNRWLTSGDSYYVNQASGRTYKVSCLNPPNSSDIIGPRQKGGDAEITFEIASREIDLDDPPPLVQPAETPRRVVAPPSSSNPWPRYGRIVHILNGTSVSRTYVAEAPGTFTKSASSRTNFTSYLLHSISPKVHSDLRNSTSRSAYLPPKQFALWGALPTLRTFSDEEIKSRFRIYIEKCSEGPFNIIRDSSSLNRTEHLHNQEGVT